MENAIHLWIVFNLLNDQLKVFFVVTKKVLLKL
jgi:hypothetical protein